MPALENNLLILFIVLAALAVIGGLGYALWKPVLSRLWRYFITWWERDKREEQRAKVEREARRRAEHEVKECLLEGGQDAETVPPVACELPKSQEKPAILRQGHK